MGSIRVSSNALQFDWLGFSSFNRHAIITTTHVVVKSNTLELEDDLLGDSFRLVLLGSLVSKLYYC